MVGFFFFVVVVLVVFFVWIIDYFRKQLKYFLFRQFTVCFA